MVVPDASLPSSEEPRRIERNGIATTSRKTAAAAANSAGRRCSTPAQRLQAGDSSLSESTPRSASSRRVLRPRMRGPMKPSSAGSKVRAATTVSETTTEAAIATP